MLVVRTALIDYCRTAIGGSPTREQKIRGGVLDKRNSADLDELQQVGHRSIIRRVPREVITRALELSATASSG